MNFALLRYYVAHAQPGRWEYPFSYTLRADLPGCVKFCKKSSARDPAWRGRALETSCSIVYNFKAELEVAGVFNKDLKCRNEVVINSFFDWNTMKPQHAETMGSVLLLCCIPRGTVNLVCDFDKAAYAAGDTAQVRAAIRNDSKSDVTNSECRLKPCCNFQLFFLLALMRVTVSYRKRRANVKLHR